MLVCDILFLLQSESSASSDSESEAGSEEPEHISGYHRLLATLKNVSEEEEEEEEEDEEDEDSDGDDAEVSGGEDADSDASVEEMAAGPTGLQEGECLRVAVRWPHGPVLCGLGELKSARGRR